MDSRFLKKILTDTEIKQVGRSDHPDMALWSIWTCKEAAYKVLKKQTGYAAFVPRRWSGLCVSGIRFRLLKTRVPSIPKRNSMIKNQQ